ncbi:3'-5' exonuclease [Flaviflexus salsibiostraticola]|uniref:3'-5' exonuclease n=1 Tax=Flaviflexus salsibiostraticola TaxID=1282737 RepID=A0A3Q8WUQ0_9ACTO|nr:exonuclease domain-containing protein [Flaviflexus salsibiostraticola]AZN30751.1 3'-5' exonuclease [Flaviflexus salsibiostraticola]
MDSGDHVRGYTVVDFETTGFSHRKGDRIVEIGVVRLDSEGRIVDSWETLINPMRHVGASHIHGISAKDVVGAPTFQDIADLFALELSGNVFVGHNAKFDATFAQCELAAAGRLDDSQIPFLDTMTIAKRALGLSRCRLTDVCDALGVTNANAHSALSDALATAQVLQAFLQHDNARDHPEWTDVVTQSSAFCGYRIHNPHYTRDGLRSRQAVAEAQETLSGGAWIGQAIGHRANPDDAIAAEYFALLDNVLLDNYLSQMEQGQLLQFARTHDLSAGALRSLHADYVHLLIHAAEADGIVTSHESAVITSVSDLLGVDLGDCQRSAPITMSAPHVRSALPSITLRPGDRVCVTGPVAQTQAYWEDYFTARGIQVAGIAKSTKVLIAGDPDSLSGKARKARQYGIPIIGEMAVDSAIDCEEPVTATLF